MKCKDIAKELETTSMHVGRVKKKLFPELGDDIPPDCAKDIRDYIELVKREAKKEVVKDVSSPTVVLGKVIDKGRNRHVLIAVAGKGRHPALMPTMGNEGNVGRLLKFEEIEYKGKLYYRHFTLSNMEFNEQHTKF